MRRPFTGPVRVALTALAAAFASPLLLYGLLILPHPIRIDLGPNDRNYVQGLTAEWRFDGEASWREMGRRARLHAPVNLQGAGTLILSVAQPDSTPVRLKAQLDDGSTREVSIPFSQGFQKVVLEFPDAQVRANVRLRSETENGAPGRLKIASASWEGWKARPQLSLLWSGAWLFALTFLALAVSGASSRASIAGTLGLTAALFSLGAGNPLIAVHLIQKGPAVAAVGLVVVGLARLVARGLTPAFLGLVYGALVLKAFLVFHPHFYFVDLPIHQTLLELVYHRGVIDFWQRFPDYQMIHNLGVAPVVGSYQPFPYPVAFYLLAHVGNRLLHDPVLWLKLSGALVAALALFPVGYIARRFCNSQRAGLLAAVIYLLIPAYTRSLLLLELSALAGHLFDLIVVAYLAAISLDLRPWKHKLGTAILIAASAAVYTSGFIHQGLLVGSCILLSFLVQGLDRRGAVALAGAGLAGAAAGLFAYHPQTISNLFLAVLPAGVGTGPLVAPSWSDRAISAGARFREFLGVALPVIGVISVVHGIRHAFRPSLRLLLAAWALSAAVAYALRFILLELFHFQKELYWLGALLAVTTGGLIIHLWQSGRWGRTSAALLVAIIAIAGFWAFSEMLPRFYQTYIFL